MPTQPSPSPHRVVTLAAIAARVKMSRSGVSRALRNDPTIPLASCRRVQAAARKLGFVNDRQLSRAFQLVRLSSHARVLGTIGFVDAYPVSMQWRNMSNLYITHLYEGARERAEELGYRLEVFSLMEPGMSARRLQGILDARGVGGLLIPTLPPEVHELPIDWDRFACVALTHTLQRPALHRVVPHQFQVMMLAIEHLHQAGYRRLGFMTTDELDVRVNHHFRAAYFSYQFNLPPADRLPILMVHGYEQFEAVFDAWLEEHNPDAIIGCDPSIVELMEQRGLTDFNRLGFVSVGASLQRPKNPLHSKVAHVVQNSSHVGRAGVDQLVAQLDRRERGIPKIANVVMIEGTWVSGITVRPSTG